MRESKDDKVADLLYKLFLALFIGLSVTLGITYYFVFNIASQVGTYLVDNSIALASVY